MDIAKCFDIRGDRLTDGDLGIEVEVEGNNLPDNIRGGMWRVDYDGSLVGESNEYVFKRPYSEAEALKALDELSDSFRRKGSEINDSVRCGVHVHVNVQKLTEVQLYNFITLYAKYEWVLLDYCGIGRRGNLFCLPLNSSPLLIKQLRDVAKGISPYMSLYSDEWRYCAMNVKALAEYGSLEFRALRGGNLGKVALWAKFLLRLREIACEYDDPKVIALADFNLSEEFPEVVKQNNYRKKVGMGSFTAMAIASSTDWDRFKIKVDKYEDFY